MAAGGSDLRQLLAAFRTITNPDLLRAANQPRDTPTAAQGPPPPPQPEPPQQQALDPDAVRVQLFETPAPPAAAPPAQPPPTARLTGNLGLDPSSVTLLAGTNIAFLLLLVFIFISQYLFQLLTSFWLAFVLSSLEMWFLDCFSKERFARPSFAMMLLIALAHVLLVPRFLHVDLIENFFQPKAAMAPRPYMDTLWITTVNDASFGLLCVAIKSVVALLPFAPFSARHSLVLVFNNVSYVYRILLPIPYWIPYFSDRATLTPTTIYFALSIYLVIKFIVLAVSLKTVVLALRQACMGELAYGTRVALASLPEADHTCAVCQDTLAHPVQLPCRHVFCEACIGRWLERERTCPMCRAQVPDAGSSTNIAHPVLINF